MEMERRDEVNKEETNHVCVEMENCDWLVIRSLQGAESWKGDRVVATEGDEFGVDV